MTKTITTAEGRACVFIAVDHCPGEFVGTHAASGASCVFHGIVGTRSR